MKTINSKACHAVVLAVAAALATIGTAGAGESSGKVSKKPHIVYLLADQWRASALGYAGDPNVKTPNIDRLAQQSLQFRNAVTVCPVCTPYRAALMTGRYPTSTGMFLNDLYLPDEELCLAEVLKSAGYATAYIGKWHLDGHGRASYIPPARRQGFDYWMAAECDHSYPRSHYYEGDSSERRIWEGYDAFAQTLAAQAYIRSHAKGDRPFALLVSYGIPHFPHHTAPEQYKTLYPPESIRLPPNVPQARQEHARREASGYYGHCTALDQCVGEVLKTIDDCGIADNTLLVFTSDHGEMMGSHGCPPCQKQTPWDESVRVPLLLRYPAVHGRQARQVTTPINTPDLMPTLLGLAGVPVPATVEGEDLSPLVRGTRGEEDRAALVMNVSPFADYHGGKEYRGIRTARYTYVRSLEGPWLLYDNQQDPYQLNNLMGNPQYAVLEKELDGRLQTALKKIGDELRPRDFYLERWGYQVNKAGCISYAGSQTVVQSPKRRPDKP